MDMETALDIHHYNAEQWTIVYRRLPDLHARHYIHIMSTLQNGTGLAAGEQIRLLRLLCSRTLGPCSSLTTDADFPARIAFRRI
jgi:hypothetical protein